MITTVLLPRMRSTAALLRPRAGPGKPARNLLARMTAWRRRSRQRRQLQTLDDRMLADIGLTRIAVEYEAQKPFWRR